MIHLTLYSICRMFKILGNGLLEKWKMMHWPKLQACQKKNSADPMSLEDVQGVFFMFTAFLFIACLELTVEKPATQLLSPKQNDAMETQKQLI